MQFIVDLLVVHMSALVGGYTVGIYLCVETQRKVVWVIIDIAREARGKGGQLHLCACSYR